MEQPHLDPTNPKIERVEININPENGEYEIHAGMIRISHMYSVLKDIIERIEEGEFDDGSNPDLKVYPIEDEEDPLN